MKRPRVPLGILSVIAYAFVLPGTASALTWVTVSPVPTAHNLRSVTCGDSQYVVVGDSGTILTSPDGLVWTSRISGITAGLRSVTYGNGQYIAIGDSSRILTSANGIIWNSRSSGTGNNLNSVTYGNGQFIAVGNRGIYDTEIVITSPDGITWALNTTGYYAHGFLVNTDLVFIFYGNGQNTALRNNIFSDPIRPISRELSDIITSSDGIHWTTIWSTPFPGNTGQFSILTSVTYGNGRYVAVGTGNLNTSATSTDGITWGSGPAFAEPWFNFVTYGNGQYVAVGGGGVIYTSPEGLTDTKSISGITSNLNSVTYGNGLYVAVGDNGTILISSGITAIKPTQKSPLLASFLKVKAHNSLLTISLPSAMLGKSVDLAVYSVSGREIMRKRVKSDAEEFTVPVSFSYGSYILVANDGSRKASIRFVAQR